MQRARVEKDSYNNEDFKTASREFDKASNVPSKKGENTNVRPIPEEHNVSSNESDNGFLKTIKNIFKSNQTNLSEKS